MIYSSMDSKMLAIGLCNTSMTLMSSKRLLIRIYIPTLRTKKWKMLKSIQTLKKNMRTREDILKILRPVLKRDWKKKSRFTRRTTWISWQKISVWLQWSRSWEAQWINSRHWRKTQERKQKWEQINHKWCKTVKIVVEVEPTMWTTRLTMSRRIRLSRQWSRKLTTIDNISKS